MTVHSSCFRVAAIATVIATSSVAQAQAPNPWGIKLGITFPGNRDVRDTIAKSGLNIGASYALAVKPLFKTNAPTNVSADLDYFRLGGGDSHVEAIHLGYSERYGLEGEGKDTGTYAGFTAGIGINKVKISVPSSNVEGNIGGSGGGGGSQSTTRSEQRVQLFAELLFGYKFQPNVALEAFYRFSPKVEGVDTSVFGIRVGYKF